MVDFSEVLRRAREGSLNLGVTDVTDVTKKQNNCEIKGLIDREIGNTRASTGVTKCYQPETWPVTPGPTVSEGVTGEVLPRNALNNKELGEQVTPVTSVTHTEAAKIFFIDQKTVEKYEAAEAEYQRQLGELRAVNARVYANSTPWRCK